MRVPSYGSGEGQFYYSYGVATDADGHIYVTEYYLRRVQKFAPPVPAVTIDVKPGSDPNSFNPKSKGVIPVAVLTTSKADGDALDFDATEVDPDSVELGPDGATQVHKNAH